MLYIFLLVGGGLAAFGFLAMRDPMRFNLFGSQDPVRVGYYQRQVLDRRYRINPRIVGMFVSFFGLVIFLAVLHGLLKFALFEKLSEAFMVLLGLTFISAFCFGLVDLVVQGIRGRGPELIFGWYKMLKQSAELGPVAAFPSFSPRMDNEKKGVYGCLLYSGRLNRLAGIPNPAHLAPFSIRAHYFAFGSYFPAAFRTEALKASSSEGTQ